MRDGRCPKCGGQRVGTRWLGAGVSGPSFQPYACADCRCSEQHLVGSVESRVNVLDSWSWVRSEKGPFR